MELSKKIYAGAYWGVTIFILLLIVVSVLLPELRKDGVVSEEAFASISKIPLWIGLGLCGLVMWFFAIQRLAFVWQWSPLNRKVSGVLFVLLFPGLCGYYLYFVDKQERKNRAIKAARKKLDLREKLDLDETP